MVAYSVPRTGHDAARRGPVSDPGTGIAFQVFLLAVFLMPLQLELEQFRGIVGSRFAPGDLCLAGSVLLAPKTLKLSRHQLVLLPLLLPVVLAFGLVLAVIQRGEVTDEALRVKFYGAFVLVVWCIVTASYARAGHARKILYVWLVGMSVWAVVAYIDWRVTDLSSFLQFDEPTRFGGTQFDVNNAGAAYGVAVIVLWRVGSQLFASTGARVAAFAVCAAAFALTLSRGSYIAVAAAALVILATTRHSGKDWARYAGAVFVALVIGLASGFFRSAVEDFANRPDTVSTRENLTDEALGSFVDSGGLGIGLGSQLAEFGQIVHNTAIWLLVEMSLVGLVYFAAVVWLPIETTLRMRAVDRRLATALLGGHVVMVVASFGIEALYQRQWWMLIGLAMAAPGTSESNASRVTGAPDSPHTDRARRHRQRDALFVAQRAVAPPRHRASKPRCDGDAVRAAVEAGHDQAEDGDDPHGEGSHDASVECLRGRVGDEETDQRPALECESEEA
jgi:O-Antigen ligase